ncbi:UDP-N-acetyl-alpha-D-glucosamine C6 dehydratase [wastewater metagenome]|uniref:UDP-N-acetyl-alpha-D-glucosamine C6 dehydratase n=2 Tax=unclassified sequences TaxID=12908 RepID=A0A5B8RFC0_9ZZZZ|nr:UDP-N-acetylglucosamine 4,6-dehydratase [Arhodomonas sp. KWT]QEA06214.1 UDP-N-acetyl-alpha-D-glucosamine C6 dehydratase [uncultured organism]
MNVLSLIGREAPLFDEDLTRYRSELAERVAGGRFLVIGGAGTIGQAVVREVFRRNPAALDVVDISENNLVELVRDLRSSLGYIDGDFRTFALDAGSVPFDALMREECGYDYVLNLSALKHVRSEKDPYSLMRMVEVNIENTLRTARWAREKGASKYFCVSTDKAAAPANMMGASKRIMELFLMRESETLPVSMARFANVAFSDGSLLHGFNQRLLKRQPLSAPNDVRRYFVTDRESGELCLLSCMLGENRDVFFPKLSERLHLTTFSEIAVRYLAALGYEAVACSTEVEARASVEEMAAKGQWPCYFFASDTTGEKDFEEFYTDGEDLDWERFRNLGVIRNPPEYDADKLDYFLRAVSRLRFAGRWEKRGLVELFNELVPEFAHKETGRYLDGRM